MLASAGYAVLRPNIRGSWGRGVAFADAVFGDLGGKEFQDILYGVEYLVEQQLVDGNRVAIGGWSYGGYIAAWAVTQSNRFKASIMGAGISDWLNMHAQTRLADADIRQLATDPLEHPEVYSQHSPMTFAGRAATPTLILHGENDPDVPVAQAYAFYRALRERNVPVELVVYPREGHGLRERLHVIDSEERVLRWLETLPVNRRNNPCEQTCKGQLMTRPQKDNTMQHHVTPETNLKDIRSATDANISPDGKRAIFVVSEWVPDKPKQRSRIWMVDTAGGDPRPLTYGPRADTCPRWSPDGQHIAFISKGGGEKDKAQLHLISSKGGEAKQLCSMPNGVSDLSWSPDGSRIAFLSLEGNEPASDPKVFTPGTGRHQRLWTVRIDSDTPEPITPDGQSIWQYAWSPDGKEFAVYYANGPDETDWYRGQIGLVAAHGGAIRQLTQLTRQACALTWSPDGTRLGYISGEWSDPDRGGGDIYVLSLQDGTTRNLTPDIECSPTWCRWFPDGRKLLYVAWDGVSNQLGIVDEANGEIKTLFRDFMIGERFWPHLSTTPDLQQCVFTHSDKYPPDVWYGTITLEGDMLSSTGRNRLTYLNPLHEDTLALAPTERIRYESVDGWQIDALLTLPCIPEHPKVIPFHP